MLGKERIVGAIRGLKLPIPYQEFYPFTHIGIVGVLTAYDRPLQIGFIARRVRSTEAEIQQKLTDRKSVV